MLFSTLLLLLCLSNSMTLKIQDVTNTISNALMSLEKNNTINPVILRTLTSIIPSNFFKKKIKPQAKSIAMCYVCAGILKYFIERSRKNFSKERLITVLVRLCTLLKTSTERVCRGTVESHIDILIYIVKENKKLDSHNGCAIIFQSYGCFKKYRPEWSIDIPNGTSPERLTDAGSNKLYHILHITDLHTDPLYEVGAQSDCGEPVCCQSDQGKASDPKKGAGKWGDYRNCDTPYTALDDLFSQIKTQSEKGLEKLDVDFRKLIMKMEPTFSYLYFTGDIISHRIWNTSRESNTEEIKKIHKLFKENFNGIQIYPVLGNHEPHPLNIFSPSSIANNLSTMWIFDLIAKEWADWLPKESLDTVRKGGYYTVLVKPGFRIIGLNSNVCYIFNWWLLYNSKDPFDQLRWLVKILTESEKNNESVHILSHVPPGDSTCLQEWTRQYRRIVQRFANTITGQFNGHTHYDEFRVFYDDSKSKIVNVAYNGGSFTAFNDLNPNYRIYHVNAQTQELVDFEQWTYDLSKANANPNSSPTWYKLYNFKNAYKVNSLKPKDVAVLINNMKKDKKLLEKYFRLKVREAEPALLKGCKKDCHEYNLCIITSTEADKSIACGGSPIDEIIG